MRTDLKIDLVAPPFAGHLFPLIELAEGLRSLGWNRLRFLSTPQAEKAVRAAEFEFEAVLVEQSRTVFEISDTESRVGSHPLLLLKQLRMNLSLMDDLTRELQQLWTRSRPDLLIADLTVPVAGLLAKQLGIRWWTSTPTPCVVETGDGIPSYLGGWRPAAAAWLRPWCATRDWAGRLLTRAFKRSVHFAFRNKLRALGVDRIYRDDGFETVYSSECILALGLRELEFERNWPDWMHFIGPLTRSAELPHTPPQYEAGRPHVLVSAGTHLWWVKQRMIALVKEVAKLVPEFVFHVTLGRAITADEKCPSGITGRANGDSLPTNMQVYEYLPYQQYADRYRLAIHHCGTGVMYACLRNAIPTLGWPQDYDQFDHLARLEYHNLGRRLVPQPKRVAAALRELADDATVAENLRRMQHRLLQQKPAEDVAALLEQHFAI